MFPGKTHSPGWGATGAQRDCVMAQLPSGGGWGELKYSQVSKGQGFRLGQRVLSDLLTGRRPTA